MVRLGREYKYSSDQLERGLLMLTIKVMNRTDSVNTEINARREKER